MLYAMPLSMETTTTGSHHCSVCARHPVVLIAVSYRPMRKMIVELLREEHGCWDVEAVAPKRLSRRLVKGDVDLVVTDSADPGRVRKGKGSRFPPERVVVIGYDPGRVYRSLALRRGAGGWLAADDAGERLGEVAGAVLGCSHRYCPRRPSTVEGESPTVDQS